MATWKRVLSDDTAFRGLIAVRDGTAVGLATLIIHPLTWSTAPACYLEDLYVTTEARREGVGRALLAHLIERTALEGWARLYWMTRADNAPARALYDRFAAADGFVRYVVCFDEDR
jgi:GNAT superfamily N-acetyltransferase